MTFDYNAYKCVGCAFQSPIFSFLTSDELKLIDEHRVEVNYHPGETIIKQGTACTHVLSYAKGLAKMYLEGDEKNVLFRLIVPGDFISGTGLFVNNRHHYTVKALRESTVCLIESDIFVQILKSNHRFWEEYLRHTQSRQIFYMDKLMRLTQKNSRGRLAEVILYLAESIYKSEEFDLDLSTLELSEMTSMSKESTSKLLKEMCREKIICMQDNKMRIENVSLLHEISKKG